MTHDETCQCIGVDTDHPSIESSGFDREKAQRGVRLLLEAMGTDPDGDDLVETWKRRVPATFETLSEGHRLDEKPVMRTFDAESDDLVVKTGIPIYSLCKHHILPYFGSASISYRPNGSVAGLSKLTRYIRWRSRGLTMQEQLTDEIAQGLADELDSPAVIVELSATHLCEAMRGVETKTETVTRSTVGTPTEAEREQFQNAHR